MPSDREDADVDLVVASGKWSVDETKAAEQWLAGYRQGRSEFVVGAASAIECTALSLPVAERLRLAQRLIGSVMADTELPISA